MSRLVRFGAEGRVELLDRRREHELAANAQMEMGSALLLALHNRNLKLWFVEHCSRVSAVVSEMADLLSLSPDEASDLRTAAQLHEIGMVAVPSHLVEEPLALDEPSVVRIRQHALLGAAIVGLSQPQRVALLVEHQYSDFAVVSSRFSHDSRETLLAGLLRVADVLDAMHHPRPYQASLNPRLAFPVLRAGTGTKFHPLAVESVEELLEKN